MSEARKKVLIKDKVGKAGVDLLEREFDVVLGIDWDHDELVRRIGEFDGLVVRSAARVTAEVIEAGTRLKVIGRAGVGVDNIDVEAATRRGIVVVNAPQSNVMGGRPLQRGDPLPRGARVRAGDGGSQRKPVLGVTC